MNAKFLNALLAVSLAGVLACSGSSEEVVPDAGKVGAEDAGPGDVGAGDPDAGGDTGVISGECDKPENVAKKESLASAQPVLEARSKSLLTETVEFPSEAGDPSVICSVSLTFKDLNGNGTLEPYEDWRLPPAERAADLVGRMSAEQKMALMAHATLEDAPSTAEAPLSAATKALVEAGIRFGRTAANNVAVERRATWANNLQEECEKSALGIPFVLSTEPAHTSGQGRVKARGFSEWPPELGLAAAGSPAQVQEFAHIAAQEYRAIGIRMALSPSADLFTDPRWFQGQSTFGEDSATVGAMVEAYIKGMQGASLGPESVACVVKHFPGAGAAKGGWDARLEKGKYLAYPGNNLDAHLAPFKKAFDSQVAGVMPGYAILESGSWSALNGLIDGTSIEQVGASFNATLLTTVLREHYQFAGLVLAPWGILEDKGVQPLGAPWGMESETKAKRVAKAVNAGVHQFGGLNDIAPIAAARGAGDVSDAQIDAAATQALILAFALGLFENPYVDAAQAPALCGTDVAKRAGLKAFKNAMVLIHNVDKPANWLNGNPELGDGSHVGDPGNAGNGSGKVLPAPPGQVYVAAGCSYFILGDGFSMSYIDTVSAGYGELTNEASKIGGVDVSTPEERIARSDYVFVRVRAPHADDPDAGPLGLPGSSLEYGASGLDDWLADVRFAREAIDSVPGSKCQLVVGVNSGRPSVIREIMELNPSAVYIEWLPWDGTTTDEKVFLDVAFGIVNGNGKLPVGLPDSDAAVQSSKEDLAGDGQAPAYPRGFGLSTLGFMDPEQY